jgi:hypothetical protein
MTLDSHITASATRQVGGARMGWRAAMRAASQALTSLSTHAIFW